MDWERLGQQIAQARHRRGWTQGALAGRAGVSEVTIRRLEKGQQRSHTVATLTNVESALGWSFGSIERVLQGHAPEEQPDEDLAAVLAVWRVLKPRERAMVRAMIEQIVGR